MPIKHQGRPFKSQPKGISPKLSVVLSPEDVEQIKTVASKKGVKVSDLMREAILSYIQPKIISG